MLLPIPRDVLEAQARDRLLDAWLGGLGVSAAVVSVSFAAYMFVTGTSDRAGPERQAVPAAGTAARPVPLRAAALPPAAATAAAGGAAIDFEPTGSIPDAAAPDAAPDRGRNVLTDFAVRDAFGGTALVEAQGNLRMVQRGMTLEGAGKVLSVARDADGWVVTTSGGLILQRR